MSVYNPNGSGDVHIDTTIGGKKKDTAKKPKPAKVVTTKKTPAKKVVQAKKQGRKGN